MLRDKATSHNARHSECLHGAINMSIIVNYIYKHLYGPFF